MAKRQLSRVNRLDGNEAQVPPTVAEQWRTRTRATTPRESQEEIELTTSTLSRLSVPPLTPSPPTTVPTTVMAQSSAPVPTPLDIPKADATCSTLADNDDGAPLFTSTPLDAACIPTYYTVRVPVVAPESMTSTRATSSSTAASDDSNNDNHEAENDTVLVVERKRKSHWKHNLVQEGKLIQPALALHLVICLFVFIVTLLADVKLATGGTMSTSSSYNNKTVALVNVVLVPLNMLALCYLAIILAACLSSHVRATVITVDKQSGKLTVGQTTSHCLGKGKTQPTPGFFDITTIQSMRVQRVVLRSRAKRYITYNLLYTDTHNVERIMFRGWSQLHELLYLQQEIQRFLSLSNSSDSCLNSSSSSSSRRESQASTMTRGGSNRSLTGDVLATMPSSSLSSLSSSFTSCTSVSSKNEGARTSTLTAAYLKVERHILAPENMVSRTITTSATATDENDVDDEENATSRNDSHEVLVVGRKWKNQTRRFSLAWWGFLALLWVLFAWMSLTALLVTKSLEPILVILYILVVLVFFLYSVVVGYIMHSANSTTLTVDRARGSISVHDSSKGSTKKNKLLGFLGLTQTGTGTPPGAVASLLDTRHVQEVVCRRHLVAKRRSPTCCYFGNGEHYNSKQRRVVETQYDVRCRDANGLEHVLVEKLHRVEEALFFEQEIESFLGLGNDDNV